MIGGVRVPLPRRVHSAARTESGESVTVGFRPESAELVGSDDGGIAAEVNLVEELGSDAFVYGTFTGHDAVHGGADIIVRVDPRNTPAKVSMIHLHIKAGEEHVFSTATGQRISS